MNYKTKLIWRIVAKVACLLVAGIVAPLQASRLVPEENTQIITPTSAEVFTSEEEAKANPGVAYFETRGNADVTTKKKDGKLTFTINQNGETRYDSVVMHLYSKPVKCALNDLSKYIVDNYGESLTAEQLAKFYSTTSTIEYSMDISGSHEGTVGPEGKTNRLPFNGSAYHGLSFSNMLGTYSDGEQICFNVVFGRNSEDVAMGLWSGNVGDGEFTFNSLMYNAVAANASSVIDATSLWMEIKAFFGLFTVSYAKIGHLFDYNSFLYLLVMFYMIVSLLLSAWFAPYIIKPFIHLSKKNFKRTLEEVGGGVVYTVDMYDSSGTFLGSEERNSGGGGFFLFVIEEVLMVGIACALIVTFSLLFFLVSLISDIVFLIKPMRNPN